MSLQDGERAAWVERVLEVRMPRLGSAVSAVGFPASLAAWQAERKTAFNGLSTLEMMVRASDHPQRDAAVVLLRANRASLTEAPQTKAQVDALERYLDEDEIIQTAEMPNVFGITLRLRTPLKQALVQLRAALAEQDAASATGRGG